MSGSPQNRWLGRIGEAALKSLTDEQIMREPLAALDLATSAMRGALQARQRAENQDRPS